MAVFSKIALSGSTDGRMIEVTATATAGTTIHTAHATALDEIHLWAVNSTASDVKLTIEYGGVTTGGGSGLDIIEFTVPTEDGLYLVVPGLVLTNSLVVRAFAGSANVIGIAGYVNRIT